jgi:hypothetical protein
MFRWFSLINTVFLVLILAALCGIGVLILPLSSGWEPHAPPLSNAKELPTFFKQNHCIEELGEGPMELKWVEPKIQLPNLRQTLLYYGTSTRPDLPEAPSYVLLSLAGKEEIRLFETNQPIYLSFQGSLPQPQEISAPYREERLFTAPGESVSLGHYTFSEDNQPTPLWIELRCSSSNKAQCRCLVKMLSDQDELILTPQENSSFTLYSKEVPKSHLIGWELGDHRVDSTLLLRQKARWIGADCFFEMHGGEVFAHTRGKQRVDFLAGEIPYSCFIGQGDTLHWANGRWNETTKDDTTIGLPLLVATRVDENVLHFKLWDSEGKGAIQLNLVRSKDIASLPNVDEEFKFIGAKTWSKFIIESREERHIVKAHDWLILTDEGTWVALDNEELVKEYVEGRLQGPLLVLEKLIKTQGEQTLVGHLFNTSRTEVHPVCLHSTSRGYLGNIPYYPPLKEEMRP